VRRTPLFSQVLDASARDTSSAVWSQRRSGNAACMTWADVDIKTALELDTLKRALPLIATESDGSARGVTDMAETCKASRSSGGSGVRVPTP
jgi:hypothetical protein